jgi:polyhydroxybutyrate depolymerase
VTEMETQCLSAAPCACPRAGCCPWRSPASRWPAPPALGLPAGDQAALVVVLHQEGGTPAGVASETALQDLRRRGAALAYPAGVDRSWDAGACCGTSSEQGIDDVAFLDAVLEDVPSQAPVDADRAALVGYSSGGMLTYRYVCQRPGRLAAAVVVSGSLESDCDESISTPDVLALHGKLDGTIGLDQARFIAALGLAPRAAVSSLGILTRSAGCDDVPATTAQDDAEVREWSGCRGGGRVQAQLVPGAGHGWATLDASRRTLDFLGERLLAR